MTAPFESEQQVSGEVGIRLQMPKSHAGYSKEIQRADDDGSGSPDTFEPLATLPGDQIDYLDLSVSPGDGRKHYRFRFTGSGCVSPGDWSDVADALPGQTPGDGTPPEQPLRSATLALDESDGSVDITIDGENTVGSIKWAQSTSTFPASGTGTVENTDENGDVTVSDAFTLSEEETGYVTITAYFRADGEGAPMDSLRITVSRGATKEFEQPSDVQNFVGDVSDEDGVRLTWDDVPEDGIKHFEIREGADFANGDLVRQVNATETTLSPRFLGQELGSRSWNFHIKAVNVEGEKSPNAASTGTLENPAPDASVLNPTASLSGLRIETDFTTAGSEASEFDLHASLSSGFSVGSDNLRDSGEGPPLDVWPVTTDWAGETVFMRIVAKDSLTPFLDDEAETAEFSAEMSLIDTPEVEPLIRQALGPIFRNGVESEEFVDWNENPDPDSDGTDENSLATSSTSYGGSQSAEQSSSHGTGSAASSGTTDGSYIEIPEEIATAFAGKTIFINFYARQPGSGAATTCAVAYSTDEGADSGWQTFDTSGDWQRFSFTYEVPESGGGSAYIGFLGDADGAGNATLFDQITIMLSAGGGVATLDEITANEIAAGTITAAEIDALTITASEIAAETITGEKMAVNELSAIVANIGTIEAGRIQDGNNNYGILISGNVPTGDWSRWLNLGDDTQPFLQHENLTLSQDGSADFSGSLSAASGTFAGSLDAVDGTFSGTLSAVDGTFEGSLNAVDGSFSGTLSAALQQAQSLEIVADVEGDVGKNVEVQLGADTLTFFDSSNNEIELRIWPDSNAISGAQSISFRDGLVFSPFTSGDLLHYESGIHGLLPIAKTIVSTNAQSGSLEEGTLYVQVN